jgi:Xaa-Pro dipeptidase
MPNLVMLLLFRGDGFDANFYHHSGVDIDHSFLLSDGKRKSLLVPRMNAALARATFKGKVAVYEDAAKELSKMLKGKKVHYDAISMSARMLGRIEKFCKPIDYSEELRKMRTVKTTDEVSKIAKAARCTKEIFESLDFKKAKTELDLKKQLLLATFDMGLEPAFEPIVASDGNTSFPHYEPGKKRIGSFVLVDYGVKYGHYCSDLTRCFILDGDRKKKEQYERLQDICWFLADALPDLGKGKEVAKLAEDLMKKAGFPKMIHSIGHGVGLEVHEHPSLGMKSDDSLSGAAMALEPAFYLARYGMRYEETVYCDGKKARIL